jgi:2-octaprenyl-6-methoxyphenol hydroxylase
MRRKSVKKRAKQNDVIVIGGGPSGLTLAVCLGAAGFSTLCIERESRQGASKRARADGRTTALSYGSMQIFEAAGLTKPLKKAACPILDIRVADRNSPLYLEFKHDEVGDNPFGWIVGNHIFRAALQHRLRALKNVRLVQGAVKNLECGDHEARAMLEDGRIFAASLVIGSDGRNSVSREEAGISTYGWAYDQTAIVCAIKHSKPHHNIAVEHFLPGGPLATLPMTKQRSSIVWTEKKDAAAELMKMNDADFTNALQEKVEDWLGTIKLCGLRVAYPLSLQHAKHYTAKRFALIGDSAHGIHPIAGQGFNLGIGDIGALIGELKRAAGLGLDIGDAAVLHRFEKRRKFANGNMVFMTDALDRLFSNSIPPVEAVRRTGLGVVQRIPPLRRFFMRTAMGSRKQTTGDRRQHYAKS